MIRHTRSHTSMVALLAILAALLALAAAPAGAETFGGLGQVGPGAESSEEGGMSNHLDAAGPIGFVADPVHGGFYTADTWLKAGKRHLRVQAFDAAGSFQREAPNAGGGGVEIPAGDSVGGLAIDPSSNRLYVLLTVERPEDAEARQHVKTDETKLAEEKTAFEEAKAKNETEKEKAAEEHVKTLEGEIKTEKAKFVFDAGQPAAAALYAFATATLERASGTGPGGLLTAEGAFKPKEEEAERDFALIDPHGIAVAPDGDVLVLGQEDVTKSKEEAASLRAAVQRVRTTAPESLGPRYVDKKNCFDGAIAGDSHCSGEKGEPSSPIVFGDGELLVQRVKSLWNLPDSEHANETFASVATAKAYESEPKWLYTLPGSNVGLATESTATGDQAQIVQTGEHTGRIYLTGRRGKAAALVVLAYTEESPNVKLSELGWTGGATARCAVPAQSGVLAGGSAAGAEGEGLLLSPIVSPASVTRFGPGGEPCAHATLAPIGVAVEGGEPMAVSEEELAVVAGQKVTFSSTVGVADSLFSTWTFQNLDGRKQPPPAKSEFSEGPLSAMHTFGPEEIGRYLVTVEVRPDDFEAPLTRQLYVIVGMRVGFKSLRTVAAGQPLAFRVKVVDPYEAAAPEFTYKWRFGDGTTLETKSAGTEPAFEHVYSKPGTYEPFLEVVDRGEHRAAAISTGVIVTAAGSPPPSGGSSGSKPAPTLKPTFSTRLSSASIVVRNGKVRLKLSCTATTGSCKGRIVLKTVRAFRAGRHGKKRLLTLAHTTFDIPAGHVTTVVLRLTRKGRSLLGRKHSLQATALVSTEQSSGQPISTAAALTLRLARRH